MVDIRLAIAKNSRFVRRPICRINRNRNRPGRYRIGQTYAICHFHVIWKFVRTILFLTILLFWHVRIILLAKSSVLIDKLIGVDHQTSIASLVAVVCWAIHQMRFWKTYQLTIYQFMQTLETACSWECPTWTTLPLVFDRSHCPVLNPVCISYFIRLVDLYFFEVWRNVQS